MGEVLSYPTKRKRAYPSARLNWREPLPPGVAMLPPKPQSAEKFSQLRRTPELILLMCLLKSLSGNDRWHFGNELKQLQEQARTEDERELADDLVRLNMELSFRLEPKK